MLETNNIRSNTKAATSTPQTKSRIATVEAGLVRFAEAVGKILCRQPKRLICDLRRGEHAVVIGDVEQSLSRHEKLGILNLARNDGLFAWLFETLHAELWPAVLLDHHVEAAAHEIDIPARAVIEIWNKRLPTKDGVHDPWLRSGWSNRLVATIGQLQLEDTTGIALRRAAAFHHHAHDVFGAWPRNAPIKHWSGSALLKCGSHSPGLKTRIAAPDQASARELLVAHTLATLCTTAELPGRRSRIQIDEMPVAVSRQPATTTDFLFHEADRQLVG